MSDTSTVVMTIMPLRLTIFLFNAARPFTYLFDPPPEYYSPLSRKRDWYGKGSKIFLRGQRRSSITWGGLEDLPLFLKILYGDGGT